MLSLVCSVIFGMLSACSVSYTMLAVTRTLTGVALSGVSLIILPLGKYGELMGVQGSQPGGPHKAVLFTCKNIPNNVI